jgi:hypothetical protein
MLTYVLTVTSPEPHLEAHKENLVAYGIEVAVAVTLFYVGGRLVARRTFSL